MSTDLFLFALAASTALALADWRLGVRLAVLVGVLQDPVRKLIPETPPLMAIASLPVWGALCLTVFRTDAQAWPRLGRAQPGLARLLRYFVASLALPTLLVFAHGLGAWRVALLGAFGYLAPLAALVVGFTYVRELRELRSLAAFYCLFTAAMLSGAFLEYTDAFPDSPLLGTQAMGFSWMRFTDQGPLKLVSGFYRSPDIMGWHAAMLVMLGLTLVLDGRSPASRGWLLPVAVGLLSVLVSGRRKAIMMPFLWLVFVTVRYLRARRFGAVFSLAAAGAVLAGLLYYAAGEVSLGGHYYEYAASIAREGPERLSSGVVGSVWTTLLQSGFLGSGIGSASLGARYVESGITLGWQESGTSKLMVELGLPGFVCALLLGVGLARAGLDALRRAGGSPHEYAATGLAGVALANAASFAVSHQVYNDLLVMTFTAFLAGVLLSAPRWSNLATAAPPRPTAPYLRAVERAHPQPAGPRDSGASAAPDNAGGERGRPA